MTRIQALSCLIPLLAATAVFTAAAQAGGDAAHGKTLYGGCMGCHSIEDNDVGPMHRGVVGRKAGTQPSYAYSAALKDSGLTWTPENLDKWLTNPQVPVPKAKMYYSVPSAKDRADLIAYLATQK